MPVYRMSREMAFDDRDVKAMTEAYEAVLAELGLTDRTHPLTEIVARKIITYCPTNRSAPGALRDLVLKDIRTGTG